MPTNSTDSERRTNGAPRVELAPEPVYFWLCRRHGRVENPMNLEPFSSKSICPHCMADWLLYSFPLTRDKE